MNPFPDAVALAQRLVGFDTVNPPGQEAACAAFLVPLLEAAGFRVQSFSHAPGRPSLVARRGRQGSPRSLCFAGHLDTVPLGREPWSQHPFEAQVVDGRLYGRGACDMKSGVAAFLAAAGARCDTFPEDAELVIVLAAGEETGCEGSSHLASLGVPLAGMAGVIIGEPTANLPMLGHKGALWLNACAKGNAAHGAAPQAGVNAIRKAAEMVRCLDGFGAHHAAHPVLGSSTLNVGTFHGGQNVNSVPDWAEVGIDIRTVPGMAHSAVREELESLLRPHLHCLHVQTDMQHVFTPADAPWMQRVRRVVEQDAGATVVPGTTSYFTDASALKPLLGQAPIVILGPGNPAQMHQTDEYCEVAQIVAAVRIYGQVIDATLRVAPL